MTPLVADTIAASKTYDPIWVHYMPRSVGLVAKLKYGSGGTTIVARVQARVDWETWVDVARFDFTTANATKHCNLTDAATGVTSYTALAAEGVQNGLLSNSFRVVTTVTGTYENTTLSIYGALR